jgi:integrase
LEKNPAERFPLYRDPNDVEHYLSDEELGRLLHVLRTDRNQAICQIVLWLLSTGSRLNETLQARWDHVDRTNRIWRIPALNSKSKRVRAIPLNDAAMGVLDALDTEGKYAFLFINKRRKQPYRNIAKVFLRLREEAGLPHLRIHDLRHQFASHLVSAGKSLYQVQQLLGHSDPKVTQRYSHLSTAALRDATDAASAAISRASKPATTATD